MSRRRKTSKTPEEIARSEAILRERKAEVARLKAQPDVRVVTTADHRIIASERLDVFAMLHQRKSLATTEHDAIRRLEEDLHVAAGAEGSAEVREAVQGGGCQERVTQRMVDASARLFGPGGVLAALSLQDRRLAIELLSPHTQGAVFTRWRQHVERITGWRDKTKQSDVVKALAQIVAAAYVAFDYRATHNPLTATARRA